MKGTILYADYDYADGVTVVTKSTKYGTFTKSVKVHPQDQDIANKYDGWYFAEMKCDIAAYKQRAKYLQERAKGIKHAYNVLQNAYKNSESPELEALYRQVVVAQNLADTARETYEILKSSYYVIIESALKRRREFRERAKKYYN